MTHDRTLKMAIRARREETGERHPDARRYVLQLRDVQPFLAVQSNSYKTHAVHASADRNDGRNPVLFGRTLCGRRNGDNHWRPLWADKAPASRLIPARTEGGRPRVRFAVESEDPREVPCTDCVARYEENVLPDVGASKTCRSCGDTRPLNKFRRNASARDGRASTCERCRREVKAAGEKAVQDARNAEVQARVDQLAIRHVSAIDAYQADPATTTFTCPRGHALTPGASPEWKSMGLTWSCDCGTTALGSEARRIVVLHDEMVQLAALEPFTVEV